MILLLLGTGLGLGALYWLSGSTGAASFALGLFAAITKVTRTQRDNAGASVDAGSVQEVEYVDLARQLARLEEGHKAIQNTHEQMGRELIRLREQYGRLHDALDKQSQNPFDRLAGLDYNPDQRTLTLTSKDGQKTIILSAAAGEDVKATTEDKAPGTEVADMGARPAG